MECMRTTGQAKWRAHLCDTKLKQGLFFIIFACFYISLMDVQKRWWLRKRPPRSFQIFPVTEITWKLWTWGCFRYYFRTGNTKLLNQISVACVYFWSGSIRSGNCLFLYCTQGISSNMKQTNEMTKLCMNKKNEKKTKTKLFCLLILSLSQIISHVLRSMKLKLNCAFAADFCYIISKHSQAY